MKVLGIAGYSGSGKTTLVRKLIPALNARGLSVSTVKHAHHAFDVDRPGKDSYEHRQAGASEVLVSSANRWALVHEHRGADEPGLDDLLAKLSPVDLVLVEGWKFGTHAKLEVHRKANGSDLLALEDPHVIAVASPDDLPELAARDPRPPVLPIDDVDGIADFIVEWMG